MQQLLLCSVVAAAIAAVGGMPARAQQQGQATPPSAPAVPANTLAEGDAAPSLAGVSWLKGEPVKTFESGRYYIIEIWATWCGPCKQSIPHLTELQAKHKDKLTIIGISCWERGDTAEECVAAARTFVEGQGTAMEYTVAADGRGFIVRNWMEPAGRRSIPTAFIIDGKGNIAWIGNPLSGMEEVLAKVLAGGFDAKVEAAKAKIAAAEKQRKDELFARANLLAQQGKYGEGLELIEQVLGLEKDAAARVPMLRQKLRMLLKSDEKTAFEFARSLLEGELKDNDFGLYTMAEAILKMPDVKSSDDQLLVDLVTRSASLASPTNASVQELLAMVRFRAGDATGAITAAEKALEIMNSPGSRASPAAVARVQALLQGYRTALEQQHPDGSVDKK